MRATENDPDAPARAAAGFAVTVAFELIEGCLEEFRRLVTENAALSVALEPGCLRFDVLAPLDGDRGHQVFLYEIYRDRAAFDRHLESGHYQRFDRATRDLVSRKTVCNYAVAENAKPDKVDERAS